MRSQRNFRMLRKRIYPEKTILPHCSLVFSKKNENNALIRIEDKKTPARLVEKGQSRYRIAVVAMQWLRQLLQLEMQSELVALPILKWA